MSHRIWCVIFGAVSKRRGEKLETSLSELSPEERQTVNPYAQYLLEVGTTVPLLSLLVWGSLGAFIAFTGFAILATKPLPLSVLAIPAILVGVALMYVARYTVYERKKRQKELYETLLEEPRQLLDSEYRSQFEGLIESGDVDTGKTSEESPEGDDPSGSSRSQSGHESTSN